MSAPDVVFASCLDLAFPGGVQRNVKLIRDALSAAGVRVEVVNRSFLPSPRWRRAWRRRLWRRVSPSSEEGFRLARAIRSVARDLREVGAGVPCVAFDAWAMMAAVRAGMRTAFRAPSTSIATEEAIGNGYLAGKSRAARRLLTEERAALAEVDLLVALCRRAGETFRGLGVAADRIRIIPNAVDAGAEPPVRMAREGGEIVLVWIGHIRPIKGLDILVDAVARLPEDWRERLRVRVVGAGADEDNPVFVRARAGFAAAGVRAEFPGLVARDAVRGELCAADLFVLSSRQEGFPNAMLEAMAAGLPVATTDVAAAPDMLGPASEGLIVPLEDPSALAAALERLLGDEGLRRRAGAGNRARVAERFSIPRLVDGWRGVIAELGQSADEP